MKQAIAYLRKSTDLQETSLEQQKEKILLFAKQHSIKVIEFFAEEACGENVEGRPQFRKMIECCKLKDDFQYVLVYDISRWGRFTNPKEAVYWEVEVERADKKVVFVSEGFKEDSIGTSITNFVKSAEASEYLKNIRRQTLRGKIYNAKQGFWMGGRPPYGYNRALVEGGKIGEVLPEGKEKGIKGQKIKLVVNKQQAKVIKTIFVMFAKQGLSVRSIVEYLNQSPYAPPRGKKWTKSSLWRILHNDVYIGTLVYNRENIHKRNGKHKYNPKDKWVVVENSHQPIISMELWELIQARTRQAFVGGRFLSCGTRPGSNYLLTGIMKCGKCGSNFQGSRYKRKDRVARRYRCGGYNMYGNNACIRWDIDADKLEEFVISYIQNKIDNSAWRKELKEELLKIVKIAENRSDTRLCELDQEIKEVSLKIENWKKAIEKGIELDSAVNIINKYVFQRQQLYQEKGRLTTKVHNGHADKAVGKMLSYLDDFKGILGYGEPERKKEFVRTFVAGIVVYPEKRQAKIALYRQPFSGIIAGSKQCVSTEDIIYQN
ncbi:MAG: recombinase family protein [Candidatus Omnitrophota bacterium]|nr:MAG: recombinase family protein [Candidatus Omnitrophota bacterium]